MFDKRPQKKKGEGDKWRFHARLNLIPSHVDDLGTRLASMPHVAVINAMYLDMTLTQHHDKVSQVVGLLNNYE